MPPSERRIRLVRLLAHIDQEIAEVESLAAEPLLDDEQRNYAAVQLDFRRKAVARVEKMLSGASVESDR